MKKLWRVLRKVPTVHGPRGATLFGFGVVCIGQGLCYVGPWAFPASPALMGLTALMAESLWGVLWCMAGAFLLGTAFKADQSKALGLATGLFSVWGFNYLIAFLVETMYTGRSYYWILAIMYLGLTIALMGMARMVNPAPVHFEVVEKPGAGPVGDLL
jgi:hypothetical protein